MLDNFINYIGDTVNGNSVNTPVNNIPIRSINKQAIFIPNSSSNKTNEVSVQNESRNLTPVLNPVIQTKIEAKDTTNQQNKYDDKHHIDDGIDSLKEKYELLTNLLSDVNTRIDELNMDKRVLEEKNKELNESLITCELKYNQL